MAKEKIKYVVCAEKHYLCKNIMVMAEDENDAIKQVREIFSEADMPIVEDSVMVEIGDVAPLEWFEEDEITCHGLNDPSRCLDLTAKIEQVKSKEKLDKRIKDLGILDAVYCTTCRQISNMELMSHIYNEYGKDIYMAGSFCPNCHKYESMCSGIIIGDAGKGDCNNVTDEILEKALGITIRRKEDEQCIQCDRR